MNRGKSLNSKSLCVRGWNSRIDAIRPICYQVDGVYDAFLQVARDEKFYAMASYEAEVLAENIYGLKFLCSFSIILFNT
jgi:hypothetical protein